MAQKLLGGCLILISITVQAGMFNESIRPLFVEHCASCHGGVKRSAGLSVIYRESVLGESSANRPIVDPGKPASSELMRRIQTQDPDDRMPPLDHGEALTSEEQELFRTWIATGAAWEEHWAYAPPQRPALPDTKYTDWVKKPLDAFVLARLEAEGLSPSPEAVRRSWLRRVSLDLTGLPPTPEQYAHFEADTAPGAHERIVDTLLASPRFGERWATMWLDFARYADSAGYEKDMHRNVWAYRDWVIRALNANMPFDTFTVKQLAGDLLPDPSLDDLIATAFHRNTKTNVEGGSNDEEFRVEAVIDRVNVTWQVWQGTTMGCVQCHAHPYDPIPHEDFYRSFAFFNNTADADLRDEYPLLDVPLDSEQFAHALDLQEQLQEVRAAMMQPFQDLAVQEEWIAFERYSVETTKEVEARIETIEALPTIVTEGTLPHGTQFQTRLEGMGAPIHALRVDVPFPLDRASAASTDGFALSHITAHIDAGDDDAEKREVSLALIVPDVTQEYLWALDSLSEESKQGWGAYPKQYTDRWAILVPDAPLILEADERLTVMFACNLLQDGGNQPVIQRYTLRAGSHPDWQQLLESEAHAAIRAQHSDIETALAALEKTTAPVLRERPIAIARDTRVFHRGNWLDPGETVTPAVPALLGSLPEDAPRNRLAAAQWLVSDENPLTARVMANHFWAQLFGNGIVATMDDFGAAGSPPSHPELLDFLALQFRDDFDWDMKRLLREIVLSATYRQQSSITPELYARDPQNRLFSRGPRNRLSAEMVRDQALALAGLLSTKMYGPPVMPPQPEGVWQVARGGDKWVTAEGEDRYRRAVYTFWKRTSPYPSFVTFDAPSRQFCNLRRITTNTPLQALITLNDPVYVECAQALAAWMHAAAEDTGSQLAAGIERASGEPASDAELCALMALYEEVLTTFLTGNEDPGPLAESPEQAALVIAANTILNLDKVLSK